jgi:hypothetical protein
MAGFLYYGYIFLLHSICEWLPWCDANLSVGRRAPFSGNEEGDLPTFVFHASGQHKRRLLHVIKWLEILSLQSFD